MKAAKRKASRRGAKRVRTRALPATWTWDKITGRYI